MSIDKLKFGYPIHYAKSNSPPAALCGSKDWKEIIDDRNRVTCLDCLKLLKGEKK
jgi:hypothetical protein